jgi:DNA-directed RNA polymerase delta subunit
MNNSKNQISKKETAGEKFSFSLALEKLFSGLNDRPKKIVIERYGMRDGKAKTLEEIGREYKITRERVRQIIKETIKKIKKSKTDILSKVGEHLKFTIEEKNGIMEEDELLKEASDDKEKGSLKFFLELIDEIKCREIPGEMGKSCMTKNFDMAEWRKVVNEVKSILETAGKPLAEKELLGKIKETKLDINQKKILNYLSVSSEIKKNNFGKWGIENWEEISPKGTREKIYLILKETGKPLHFKEIANLIDRYQLNKKRKTHPQTVHNELIRDKRFVLVGRGIYALSEWGYQRGTVKEVLEDILEKSNKPMSREEIMNKILSVRKVKKSTVLINLNNFFQKVGKNEYSIKK